MKGQLAGKSDMEIDFVQAVTAPPKDPNDPDRFRIFNLPKKTIKFEDELVINDEDDQFNVLSK